MTIVSLFENTTPIPALSLPFPTPQMVLPISQSATHLQPPLIAIGLHLYSPRQDLMTAA